MFYMNPDWPGADRYDIARFYRFVKDMYDVLDSEWVRELALLPKGGEITVTTQAYRPDLLARDVYGKDELWPMLLQYAGLMSEESIQVGMRINYPRLADVESLYFRFIALARSKGNG